MRNALTVDVENYCQVAAFSQQINHTNLSRCEARLRRLPQDFRFAAVREILETASHPAGRSLISPGRNPDHWFGKKPITYDGGKQVGSG